MFDLPYIVTHPLLATIVKRCAVLSEEADGEDVKVVQELLRHSTSRMTLDTYTQALGPDKRAAQSRVVGMIRPKERVFSVYRDADGVSV
jgi:integrase